MLQHFDSKKLKKTTIAANVFVFFKIFQAVVFWRKNFEFWQQFHPQNREVMEKNLFFFLHHILSQLLCSRTGSLFLLLIICVQNS